MLYPADSRDFPPPPPEFLRLVRDRAEIKTQLLLHQAEKGTGSYITFLLSVIFIKLFGPETGPVFRNFRGLIRISRSTLPILCRTQGNPDIMMSDIYEPA